MFKYNLDHSENFECCSNKNETITFDSTVTFMLEMRVKWPKVRCKLKEDVQD